MLYHDLFGLLGIVEITEHDRRSGDADLSLLAEIKLLGRAGLEYCDGSGQKRVADAEALKVAVAAAGYSRGHLAHSVALGKRILAAVVAQKSVELCLQAGIHRVAAAACGLEKAKVEAVFHFLAVHQLFIVSGNEQGMRGLVFLNQMSDLVRIKLGDHDNLKPQ